jgi:uncharacterized phage protein (TIGR01671 family)
MENRYLFRGKLIDNGEWVEGFYFCMTHPDGRHTHHFIMPIGADLSLGTPIEKIQVEVDPSTVCQCTGLEDKNGKMIWENDIVKDKHGNLYKAFWQNNYYQFSFICVKSGIFQIGMKWNLWSMKSYEIEVVGNVLDNPELLEVPE